MSGDVMPYSFSQFYRRDRIEFINDCIAYFQLELDHARSMCRYFLTREVQVEYHNWCYYRSILAFVAVLDGILKRVRQQTPRADSQFEPRSRRCQSILRYYPTGLHNILVSALQRKQHPIRYFSYSPFPSYTFSESHPTYPLDIESIEKVNIDVFDRLKPVFGNFKINVPFITLSTEMDYAFSFLPLLNYNEIVKPTIVEYVDAIEERDKFGPQYQEKKEQFLSTVSEVFSLGRILMPRWAPIELRATGFLAHEQFHLVMQFIDFFIELVRTYCETHHLDPSSLGPELEDYLEKFFAQEFGSGIYKIARCRTKLLRSFIESFGRELTDEQGAEKEACIDYKYNMHFQLIELLCDLGGVLLMGPAYLFAFNSDLLYSEAYQSYQRDESAHSGGGLETDLLTVFSTDHPPDTVRLHLILELLKRLGFGTLAQECNDDFSRDKVLDRSAHRKYLEWINQNLSLFIEFGRIFCEEARLSVQLSNDSSARQEQGYRSKCQDIFEKVRDGNFLLHNEGPIDILNAIWYKMKNELLERKLTLEWRFAVKYSGVRRFGQIQPNSQERVNTYEWRESSQDTGRNSD
jgi:hypothetical protein